MRGKEGRRASYLAGRFFFLCFTFACFLPAANVLVALPSSSVNPSITLNSFRKVDLLGPPFCWRDQVIVSGRHEIDVKSTLKWLQTFALLHLYLVLSQ